MYVLTWGLRSVWPLKSEQPGGGGSVADIPAMLKVGASQLSTNEALITAK